MDIEYDFDARLAESLKDPVKLARDFEELLKDVPQVTEEQYNEVKKLSTP